MQDLIHTSPNPIDSLDLHGILRLSTMATLESLGQTAVFASGVSADWRTWRDPIAFVGFGGESVRGALVLGTPWTFLRASEPVGGSTKDDLLDWSRELANVLLGSIKSALLSRGIRTSMGLPISVSGSDVRFDVSGSGGIVQVFHTHHDDLVVGLDLCVESIERTAIPPPTADMIFF